MIRPALCTLVLASCVTVDGERRFVAERTLPSKCHDAVPTAALDPARDRIRLVFHKSVHCDDAVEAVYETPRLLKLDEAPRGVATAAVAMAALIPLELFLANVFPASPSAHYEYFHPTPLSREREFGRDTGLLMLALVPATLAALGAWYGFGALRVPISARQDVVRHTQAIDETVAAGVVAGPRLAARALQGDTLELSFEAAQGLSAGELMLDGERVRLELKDLERLSFLPDCAEALSGFDATTAREAPLEPQRRRWERAVACDAHGWGFADDVADVLRPRFNGTDIPKR